MIRLLALIGFAALLLAFFPSNPVGVRPPSDATASATLPHSQDVLPVGKRGINRETCDRITPAMPLDEVIVLLGCAPGDHRTKPVELNLTGSDAARELWLFDLFQTNPEVLLGRKRYHHEWWQGDAGSLWVCCSTPDNRVRAHSFIPAKAP